MDIWLVSIGHLLSFIHLAKYFIALKFNINNTPDPSEGVDTYCALHVCPPHFGSIVVNNECMCSRYKVLPEKRQNVEQDEARICAVRVCPPRFGGIIVNGVCECTQLVGLRPTPSTVSTIQPTKTPTAKDVKRQEIAEDEAHICAVRVCPPRFGGILVNGVCECTQLVGLPIKPSTSTNLSAIQPSKTPAVERQEIVEDEAIICAVRACPPRFGGIIVNGVCGCKQLVGRPLTQPSTTPIAKRQEIVEEDEARICAVRVCPPRFGGILVNGVCECTQLVGLRPATTLSKPTDTPTVKRQDIFEDEATICAVRVCPPRFGAIIVDGVCTCKRFGLPPPKSFERSSSGNTKYKDCDTPCAFGYIGKRIGPYCKCFFNNDLPLFPNAVITKRQDVDNCFARTCPPRYFSAPDGKGGCDCIQGTKFAPPSA